MMEPMLGKEAKNGWVMSELVACQSALFAYIYALTARSQDAQDVLQETNLKICKRADTYDPARPFLAWAKTIAVYEVMTYRKKQHRDRLVTFEDDVFENVAACAEREGDALTVEPYLRFLETCLEKLPATLREIIDARYLKGGNLRTVAQRFGRSPNAVALLLMRARRSLADCVRLAAEKGGDA